MSGRTMTLERLLEKEAIIEAKIAKNVERVAMCKVQLKNVQKKIKIAQKAQPAVKAEVVSIKRKKKVA